MADLIAASPLAAGRAPVSDTRFQKAYDAVDGPDRGRLKTAVKYLFEMYHDHRAGPERVSAAFAGGFALTRETRPRDFALVLTMAEAGAPAPVLAAALPALLAGVGEVCVACLDGKFSDATLAALELAGIETALETTQAKLAKLPWYLAGTGAAGMVMVLGAPAVRPETLAGLAACPGLDLFVAPPVRLAVLAASRTRWDWRALGLAQGGAPVAAYGFAPEELPAHFTREPGGLAELLAAGPLAACLPENVLPKALGRVPLALSPGREACFAWPGLTRERFYVQTLGLSGRIPR